MSTIASPRPSISLSSRRGSNSTDNTTTASTNPRRNRLRDYYNLQQSTTPSDVSPSPSALPSSQNDDPLSALDNPNFEPSTYVSQLLAQEGLESVLRTEANLLSSIRNLDGEKKALVYDNYSKLIAATETIKRMREKMDPLTETSSLKEDLGKIAETAAALRGQDGEHEGLGSVEERRRKETVRWALSTPQRLQELVKEGKRQEAEARWIEVEAMLENWEGVKGVAELRQACLEAVRYGQEDG